MECPDCSAKLPVLGYTAKGGFCVRCGAELKQSFDGVTSLPVAADSLDREISNAVQLGNLLATAARCEPPIAERVLAVIAVLRRLCRLQGIPLCCETHKKSCGEGHSQPSLFSLLNICENAGISLIDFMTAPVNKLEVSPKLMIRRPAIKSGLRRFDAALVAPRLRELIDGDFVPPPSLRAVAVLLNAHVTTLYTIFPDLCRMIVSKHRKFVLSKAEQRRQRVRAEVWQVAAKLAEAGIGVTESRVAKLLKQPGSIRDPVARQALREFIAERRPS